MIHQIVVLFIDKKMGLLDS